MPNNALFPLIACALVLSAVGADYGLGQMDVPKSHRLPIETFPAVIGSWKGGPVQEVGLDIQRRLPTAKIVERVYTNGTGPGVDLMLLTATEDEDMHSPQACFPSQGWTLSNVQNTQVDGQPVTRMTAAMDEGQRLTVLYWLTGYYPPAPPRNALLQKAYAWRTHIMGGHNNMSLFVRMTAPDTLLGRRDLAAFTDSSRIPLQALTGAGAAPSRGNFHRVF